MFAALGIPVYGLREIARYNHDPEGRQKVFSELFLINCLGAIAFSGIYLVTIYSVPALHRELEFLLITGISVVFVPLNVDWFFSGREKFKLVTIRTLAAKVIALAGLFIFVRNRDDIIPYLLLTVTANLSSQVWNFGYMWKTEVKFRIKNLDIKRHIRSVFILFSSRIAVSMYTMINVILLGFISDHTQVGYYTSAVKISSVILLFVTAMSPVMIARINTIKDDKDCKCYPGQVSGLLSRSFEYMMMLAVPATVGLIVTAPRFVPLFFGAEFIPSTSTLQLVSLIVILVGVSNLFGTQILVAMGHEKKQLIALISGAAANLLLCLLLIGKYGSEGASVASVAAETIIAIAVIVFSRKIIRIRLNIRTILHPVTACIPFIFIAKGLSCIIKHDLIYLITTVVICGSVYLFMLVFIFRNNQARQIIYSITDKIKIAKKNK
jgi:O-antigen/teichoic acid export membrane protein